MSSTADQTTPTVNGPEDIAKPRRDTEWLTTTQAAAYAGGIGVSTIRAACNRNALRHVRIGGGISGPIRTRKEWVADWLLAWERGGEIARFDRERIR
jgi:hypothetical protein